jgi:hypothetical protein
MVCWSRLSNFFRPLYSFFVSPVLQVSDIMTYLPFHSVHVDLSKHFTLFQQSQSSQRNGGSKTRFKVRPSQLKLQRNLTTVVYQPFPTCIPRTSSASLPAVTSPTGIIQIGKSHKL